MIGVLNLLKIKNGRIIKIVKELIRCWSEDKISSFAAAFAYYALFALGPLLFICITICNFFFNDISIQEHVFSQISQLFGVEIAARIRLLVLDIHIPSQNFMTTIFGFLILLFGTSGLFIQLQIGLNTIWKVNSRPQEGFIKWIKNRFIAVILIIIIAMLLFLSLMLNILLTTTHSYLNHVYFNNISLLEWIILLSMLTLLFGAIFKILPDITLQWRNVWLGAIITAILFVIGKTCLGLYLSKNFVAGGGNPTYSLVILLIWVYYSAQIIFLGAALTKICTTSDKE